MDKFFLLLSVCLTICVNVNSIGSVNNDIRLNLIVSAKYHKIEIIWTNIPEKEKDGYILLTTIKPVGNFEKILTYGQSKSVILDNSLQLNKKIITSTNATNNMSDLSNQTYYTWRFGNEKNVALFDFKINKLTGWVTTNITFNRSYETNINITTSCYGYWLSYVNVDGVIIGEGCLRAYPTWMQDMKDKIQNFCFKDLFIPGTHDSGSFRSNFSPLFNETIISKYSITQDQDIRSQLLHGIRYIDMRVGYYEYKNTQFWANHGVSRQQPLIDIFRQVRDFVIETNEIVILDFQEFPVGFGKKLNIHQKLVALIEREVGDFLVTNLSWSASLKTIWDSNRNIIVGYDHHAITHHNPRTLFQSVEHKWGNVQSLSTLQSYLLNVAEETARSRSSRPKAAMAELTPKVWGVITDEYGGLRVMADRVNKYISIWYSEGWGSQANIVAVDFFRGTNIIDSAIYWNLKKGDYVPLRYDIIDFK